MQLHNDLKFSTYPDEIEILQKVRENARFRKIPVINDDTGRFLEAVCFILNPTKMLEIGCGIGYSTFFMLKNFKNFKNLNFGQDVKEKQYHDSKDKKYFYTGIDLNKDRVNEAENFIKESLFKSDNGESPSNINNNLINIRFLAGNALNIIPQLDDRFDLVFVDAAKFEYPLYIKALEGKLDQGAAVIADNIFYSKKIFNTEIDKHDKNSVAGLKKYLDYVTQATFFRTGFFNISDGLAVSIYEG